MKNTKDNRFLELLEKWHEGDFSKKDAHEMNTLVQNDPFQKEAWEGFQTMPESDHEAILSRLRGKIREKQGLRTGGIHPRWIMAAAAAVLLAIMAVWLIQPKQNDEGLVAHKPLQNDEQIATQAAPTPADNGTIQQENDKQVFGNQGITHHDKSKMKPVSSAPPGNQWANDAGAAPAVEVASEAMSRTDDVADVSTTDVKTEAEEAPKPVEEKALKELPAAPVLSKKPATVPTSTEKARAKNKASTDSIEQWAELKEPADMDKLRADARKKTTPAKTEPGGGWDMFNDYLRQNARLTPAARKANVSGTVRLQFSINQNGEPQGIVMLRSMGYGLDQEARRLVENWVWVRGVDPFVTVEIPFVR